jgi:quercetin dioxygenase-like cupin family protein
MNTPLTSHGDIVDLCPITSANDVNQAVVLVRTDDVTIVQLLIPAGSNIPIYEASGEIILHCVQGRVSVDALGEPHELRAGQLLHLAINEPFSIHCAEAASLLATVIAPKQGSSLELIGDQ